MSTKDAIHGLQMLWSVGREKRWEDQVVALYLCKSAEGTQGLPVPRMEVG